MKQLSPLTEFSLTNLTRSRLTTMLSGRTTITRSIQMIASILDKLKNIPGFTATQQHVALLKEFVGGVAQLASSWVPSTRNFKPSIDERTALNSIERHSNVSWACGPRLEASRAIPQE